MQSKWYQKTWLWLCIISSLILVGIILFAIYLYELEFINFVDIRFVIMDENGNYSWGVFWTCIGAVGSIVVAILAYILSKKLGIIQIQQYELEAMPFIMLGNISIKHTSIIAENGRFIGFKDVEYPYYTDKGSDAVAAASPMFLEVELMNTSKTFCRVVFDECVFENDNKTVLQFNRSTNNMKCNDLFLEPNGQTRKGLLGLVFANDAQKLRGCEVRLSLILRNSYGDAYEQELNFYCMAVEGTNVLYGLKGFMPPVKMKKVKP